MEAATKLKETDDEDDSDKEAMDVRDKAEFRSESIAALRAKAQEHSAKFSVHDNREITENNNETLIKSNNMDTYKSRFEEPQTDDNSKSHDEIDVVWRHFWCNFNSANRFS